MLRKVEHNFLSNVDNLFPFQLQFPFPWLIKKLIDDIATGVYLLFQDGMLEIPAILVLFDRT